MFKSDMLDAFQHVLMSTNSYKYYLKKASVSPEIIYSSIIEVKDKLSHFRHVCDDHRRFRQSVLQLKVLQLGGLIQYTFLIYWRH